MIKCGRKNVKNRCLKFVIALTKRNKLLFIHIEILKKTKGGELMRDLVLFLFVSQKLKNRKEHFIQEKSTWHKDQNKKRIEKNEKKKKSTKKKEKSTNKRESGGICLLFF